MKVKIKKLHPNAVIPQYAKPGDAGMDLTAVSVEVDDYGNVSYGTGLAFEIPKGYVGLVFPRSSNCKKGVILSNSVGVIDSGYRGEVHMKFRPNYNRAERVMTEDILRSLGIYDDYLDEDWYELDSTDIPTTYKVGDRIGQIIILPYPHIEFEEVEELSETERGTGGHGSSGR